MLLVIGILFAVVGIGVEGSPMATVFHGRGLGPAADLARTMRTSGR
jgi:hypothetical protein